MSTDTETDEFVETDPTPRERLTDIRARIMAAQDAVGWAVQGVPEFDETIARSFVEYGRCLRDLTSLVQTLLPEESR